MSSSDEVRVRAVPRPTAADLAAAREVIGAHLPPTPLVRLPFEGDAGEVFAKLESMQPTGSFKVRGALAAVSAYAGSGARIVTASAGNHGLGVAYAAAQLKATATVVVPRTASRAKVEALRAFDVELVEHGEDYDEAEQHALRITGDDGLFLSAYNDPHVIAGQATCIAEVAAQLPGGFTALVPVGGGGLLSGTVLQTGDRPDIRVIGVETVASRGFSAAVAAGQVVEVPVGATLADGLSGNLEPGSITPALSSEHGPGLTAVDEDQIAEAIRYLAHRCGLVVEGSGAVGVAALRSGGIVPAGGPHVVLLTGRNIAAPTLLRVLENAVQRRTSSNARPARA